MSAKHTPGPWEIVNGRGYLFVQAKTPEGHPYEGASPKVEIMSDEDYPTKEADAQLIAAAPELLEALRDAAEALEHLQNSLHIRVNPPTLDKCKAVIAKAEGQS